MKNINIYMYDYMDNNLNDITGPGFAGKARFYSLYLGKLGPFGWLIRNQLSGEIEK